MKKGTREEASCLQHLGTGTLRSARKCAEVSALLIAHFNPPHQSRCHFSNVCSFVLVGLLVQTGYCHYRIILRAIELRLQSEMDA
jgi:hypothetical protein